MSGPLDWSRLTQLAVEAHATPGLWAVVSAFPNLPDDARALQSVAVINDFRRYHIRSLLGQTVRDLRQAGVEVLVLKGAAMLAGAVANATPRTMADIDLLVTSGSPEHAWRVCQEHGWFHADRAATEEHYRAHHHLPPLVDSRGIGIGLELHRSILPGVKQLGLDTDGLLARSRIVSIGEVAVRVPSLEDMLVHACLHFAWSNKLGRGAWRTYADVHAIVADPAFDWERFLGLVTSRRVRQSCYWTLRMGTRVADLPVPAHVLPRLDSSLGGSLGPLLERHFACRITNPDLMSTVAERVQRRFWFAAMRESTATDEADVWFLGAIDTPAIRPRAGSPRSMLRTAIATASYLTRLALKGD